MDLNKVLAQLEKYKNDNKEEVLSRYVQDRLNASLSTYYKELEKSINYVAARNVSERAELKIMKKINGRRI